MKARFQADASLRAAIVSGVRRREPSIDFLSARVLADKTPDPIVLALAAADDRILVSHDVHTMPGHFADFVRSAGSSPGLFLIPQRLPVVESIEQIVLIWSVSEAEEWRNTLVWLPL